MCRTAFAALTLTLCILAAKSWAADGADKVGEKKPDKSVEATLPRLLASFESQPLAVIGCEDVRALPEKFAQSSFDKMLRDPSYAKGAAHLRALINHEAGMDIAALWPDFSKHLSGPATLALVGSLPGEQKKPISVPAEKQPANDLHIELRVLVPNAEAAKMLQEQWPKPPRGNQSLLTISKLVTINEVELPAQDKVPKWASEWPKGDVALLATPRKLHLALKEWFESSEGMQFDIVALAMESIRGADLEKLSLSMSFAGERIAEELVIELSPECKNAFSRVVSTLRQEPAPWNALLGATPGEMDAALQANCDFRALGPDLPDALQATERFLRGKKWTQTKGYQPESLAADRFEFLLRLATGAFSIVAKPTLAGDVRAIVAARIKNEEKIDAIRAELVKQLENVGAEFDTLAGARKIGEVAPLGALFKGRGIFTAPVIGLSPGWAWLCSSSSAYLDLTTALKTGKTLATEAKQDTFWRANDAVRLQIDLEKVVKIAYAAWMLSGAEPRIGSFKVHPDLLPAPTIFDDRLGTFRTGLSRQGRTLTAYSHSAVPFSSLLLPGVLQEAADTIENTRRATQRVLAREKPDAGRVAPEIDKRPVIEKQPEIEK
jgi:hypothetical protein